MDRLEGGYLCADVTVNYSTFWTRRVDLTVDLTHPHLYLPIPQNLFRSLLLDLRNTEATNFLYSRPQHLNFGPAFQTKGL